MLVTHLIVLNRMHKNFNLRFFDVDLYNGHIVRALSNGGYIEVKEGKAKVTVYGRDYLLRTMNKLK